MAEPVVGERVPDIQKAAAAAGVRITREGISASHRRGHIPKPIVRRPGRGSESIYPIGTANQVIACEHLRQRFGRDPKRVGWELWVARFPVTSAYWQSPLLRAWDDLLTAWDRLTSTNKRAGGLELADEADAIIGRISAMRSPTSLIGALRRLLRGRFSSLIWLVMEVFIGRYRQSDSDEHQIFVLGRLLGLRSPSKKLFPTPNPSWFMVSVDEFQKMLQIVSRVISNHVKERNVVFSDAELDQASIEFTMLLGILLSLERVERLAYGRSSPSLNILSLIARDLNVQRHALFVLGWLIVRKIPAIGEGAQRFLQEANLELSFGAENPGACCATAYS